MNKSLNRSYSIVHKDPKIAAVAAAVMQEEEDRELQEAMEATGLSIYPDDYIDPYPYQSRRRMMSLGNVSAPPTLNQAGRFSSIGKSNAKFLSITFPCNNKSICISKAATAAC